MRIVLQINTLDINKRMNHYLISVNDPDLVDVLAQIIEVDFDLSLEQAKLLITTRVIEHLQRFKDDTKLVIERGYVDRVYRDSFYTYYASKRTHYCKDTIKLSFFEDHDDKICSLDVFAEHESVAFLNDCYRGFIVLRPTIPFVVGRSAIAPALLKINSFKTCLTTIPSTCMGLQFEVQAFPFSSQDTETISCAETMIWALMEYYGNKYPEYSPVLPSKILNVLRQNVVERQLPSSGLSVESMSYLLKECGFGPKLYSRDEFEEDFDLLLSSYVESGIPIIVALDNAKLVQEKKVDRLIGHAALCIGHENISKKQVEDILPRDYHIQESEKVLKIRDWDCIKKNFVFIDDNFPVYQSDNLDTPTGRYVDIPENRFLNKEAKTKSDKEWGSCIISHFVVPLYKRIYLEAYMAKKFVYKLLCSDYFNFADKRELYIRTFLCSARVYRDYAMLSDMGTDLKNIILNKSLPRYVWVTEVSDDMSIGQNRAKGLILLDATEANVSDFRPLIFALCNGYQVQYDKKHKAFVSSQEKIEPFTMYESSLKYL